MAALMREHPDAGAEAALHCNVRGPQGDREDGGEVRRQLRGQQLREERGVVDVCDSDVEERGGNEEVEGEVGEGADEGALEAVRGDGALQIRESEGRLDLREDEERGREGVNKSEGERMRGRGRQ